MKESYVNPLAVKLPEVLEKKLNAWLISRLGMAGKIIVFANLFFSRTSPPSIFICYLKGKILKRG